MVSPFRGIRVFNSVKIKEDGWEKTISPRDAGDKADFNGNVSERDD